MFSAQHFGRFVVQHARLLAVLSVGLTLALASGLGGLALNASYNAYFDRGDPILQTHRELEHDFSQNDSVVVIVEFAPGQALSDEAIDLLRTIDHAVRALPNVIRVGSVLDLFNPKAETPPQEQDDLLAMLESELASNVDSTVDPATIAADPRGVGLTVARNRSALLLDISYALGDEASAPLILATLEQLRATIDAIVAANQNVRGVRYSGAIALNEAYIGVVRHDLAVFLPVLLLTLFVSLGFLLRSHAIAAALLLIGTMSVISAFGIAGWFGLDLAAINAFAPVIVMSLALAGGVHLTAAFYARRQSPTTVKDAVVESIVDNLLPLSLTNATTALGFLGLVSSPSPPVRAMGYIVATGVVCAWGYSLTVLPLVLGRVPRNRDYKLRAPRLQSVGVVVTRRPLRILLPFAAMLLVSGYLVSGNEINDNVFEYFPPDHALRQDANFVLEHFSGINKVTYGIEANEDYGVFDGEFLRQVRSFTNWAKAQPEVNRVISLVDIPRVRDRLGDLDNADLIARYRNLARGHTNHGLGVEQLVDAKFKSLAIHLYLRDIDAKALTEFDLRARNWLASNTSPNKFRGGGGSSLVFAHLGQRNARSMVFSLGAALLVVSFVCALALRSWHAVWIGLVCNTAPLILVYAVWAVADGRISIGGAVVVGMILGIIVDDTVYLLTQFVRLSRAGAAQAAATAVMRIGPALVVTSITLVAGLSAGLLSAFQPIVAMSSLSMAVIAAALIIDLLILPALLSVSASPNECILARPETVRES